MSKPATMKQIAERAQVSIGTVSHVVNGTYGRKIQAQEVLSQSSFCSSNDPRLHFGLGPETSADIEIRWPSGLHETLKGVQANQFVAVKEGIAGTKSQ